MKDLKGSKTEQNLQAAFAGESQARNKYGYWACVARKEGYEQIAAIFDETAGNEREHAKIWFELLGGIGTTAANLTHAAEGEHYEWTEMYKGFAEEARAEGFNEVAMLFEMVAKIEKRHDERYQLLAKNLEEGLIFVRPEAKVWICRNCGHTIKGEKAPKICSVCKHPQAYFEIISDNF